MKRILIVAGLLEDASLYNNLVEELEKQDCECDIFIIGSYKTKANETALGSNTKALYYKIKNNDYDMIVASSIGCRILNDCFGVVQKKTKVLLFNPVVNAPNTLFRIIAPITSLLALMSKLPTKFITDRIFKVLVGGSDVKTYNANNYGYLKENAQCVYEIITGCHEGYNFSRKKSMVIVYQSMKNYLKEEPHIPIDLVFYEASYISGSHSIIRENQDSFLRIILQNL